VALAPMSHRGDMVDTSRSCRSAPNHERRGRVRSVLLVACLLCSTAAMAQDTPPSEQRRGIWTELTVGAGILSERFPSVSGGTERADGEWRFLGGAGGHLAVSSRVALGVLFRVALPQDPPYWDMDAGVTISSRIERTTFYLRGAMGYQRSAELQGCLEGVVCGKWDRVGAMTVGVIGGINAPIGRTLGLGPRLAYGRGLSGASSVDTWQVGLVLRWGP
jgi:hypothetical protein